MSWIRRGGRIGGSLADALQPYAVDIAAFADNGSARLSRSLAELWAAIFPMVLPPDTDDGLGIIVLNSNAETHFSFTNALGLVSAEQARACSAAINQYPRAHWIVALHHHVVEYPQEAKELSERIGTALINGSWFIRRLLHLGGRAVIMHGHRHIDWIGECGGLQIVSAPSPVMGSTDHCRNLFLRAYLCHWSRSTAQAFAARADQFVWAAERQRSTGYNATSRSRRCAFGGTVRLLPESFDDDPLVIEHQRETVRIRIRTPDPIRRPDHA